MKRSAVKQGKPAHRRPLVLVFGESMHDRGAICRLTEGLRPDLAGIVEPRRTPLVLIKNAKPNKARTNAQDIAKLVRQETGARNVIAVLAHQDCDAVEPSHVQAAAKIEATLSEAGCPGVPIGVTPAWEIEAWWLVFPEAIAPIVEGWREPNDWMGKDVGTVENAKETLTKALRPKDKQRKTRDYHEADSLEIAHNVVHLKLLSSFDNEHRETRGKGVAVVRTRSRSFGRFRHKLLALPTAHNGDAANADD